MSIDKELIDAVLDTAASENGRRKLTCAEAFALAGEFDAQIAEIGRVCNQQNVKICKCQLGCFK